ncbi:MAG: PAS domain-containing protein [Xanthomonadales bacterium]|jgi:predicted transcriptional regulator YheO|nr:PAS domain-containing protein [Xanthomonadales bacterium]MDH3925040.1 PAS domain-containing protein [Xanthomonadales bacterium]MDH3939908.1 PAS domain-containing protein [Xanthomonadales bacterium]MDH4001624.1 PAS domain-containing protein [Xanthomonadales bacterium]
MDVFAELAGNVLASVILLGFGFLFGKYRERRLQQGRNLEEYDFYPFDVDEDKALFLDLERFSEGVSHLLRHRDRTAAEQLILIGQQNSIESRLTGDALRDYLRFYSKYGGDKVMDDTNRFLENYERIVRLIGESFPETGIEILLHNLSNPAKALAHLQNNVTGRNVGAPATNLVHDLKTRRLQNQDKLNYELNIGSRKFKCTTIPIYREKLGLVGAVCINVDYHYLDEVVRNDPEKRDLFLDALLRTDMVLDENILSKDEYENAKKGKRHFRDFSYSS